MWRLACLSLCAAVAVSARAELVLAERGQAADRAIVVPEETAESVRYAAEELRDFTEKTVGVRLPIVTDADPLPPKAILLGQTRYTRDSAGDVGTDGFRLLARPPHLFVMGSPERGVLYGAYELLERYAGCRWYASWHAVVPKLERLAVPAALDVTEKPAFVMREPHWYDVLKHPDFAARLRVNARSWCRTEAKYGGEPCRFGGGLDICHTFEKLLPTKEFFDTHPEYFSMMGGRRVKEKTQPCLTNPDVLRIVTERVLERIRKDPGARFYGVSQNDNTKGCTCPECKAVDDEEGSRAGTLVRFLNALGEAVEKEFPDAVIETLAYQYTRRPPKKTRLRHNVVPCLCTIECDFAQPIGRSPYRHNIDFLSDIKGWSAQTDGLLVWDYTTDFSHFPLPFANVRSLQGNLRLFRANGARYVYEEGDHKGRHADFGELKTWLLAKWMWNPDLPEAELLDDFFAGYYGAGAPFVRRYFEELHRRQGAWSASAENPLLVFDGTENPALTDRFLAQAAECWAQAAKAARDDPACSYNVRMGSFSVDYARIARSAKLVRFTEAGALSPEENRALAQSLLDRMAEAGDIRLSLGSDAVRVKRWRAIADGSYRPAPVAEGRAEVEECYLGLSNPGRHGEFVIDPLAEDGRALKLFNTHFEWCATFGMDNCAFRPGVRYALSVRARAEVIADGEAFWAGVYDKVEERGRGGIEPRTKDVPDGYRWYDIITWEPKRSEYLWIGPGRFGKDGRSAVRAVWIDKIAFRPVP
ncbi:MAG: DUF4838 domain-containing protein [Kiritimatiellae bacterium]|nr:DUF4838 domain-containing protein [Kiritimatiellia bacterium]